MTSNPAFEWGFFVSTISIISIITTKEKPIKYLASVYSIHAKGSDYQSQCIRNQRAQYAMDRASEFFRAQDFVFSPIAHCHEMSCRNDMPKDFTFWKAYDHQMIDASDGLYVLMMPHWAESEGITSEIYYAMSTGKSVTYISCSDYSESYTGETIHGD